ncbi:MAG: hypothetical protein DME45_02615 [Verrucomicrobia bacterium]|nr:MAG: hypothetical protein DME45_02615 [Verrucomicrobiota bacterium]PYK76176.1 MAG: hypothetical protein DME42_00660 [Verrucomicrobiota bacterium]
MKIKTRGKTPMEFAVAVVELTDDLPNTRAGNCKDFIHKLKVCLKELPAKPDGGSAWYHGSRR